MFKLYNLSPLTYIGTAVFIAGILLPETILNFWEAMFYAIVLWSFGATSKQDEFGEEIDISKQDLAKLDIPEEELTPSNAQHCINCGKKYHKDIKYCPYCKTQSRYQVFVQKTKLTRVVGSVVLFAAIFAPEIEFITGLVLALILWFIGDIKGIQEPKKESEPIKQKLVNYYKPANKDVENRYQYCSECGTDLAETASYCPNCGAKSPLLQANYKIAMAPHIR